MALDVVPGMKIPPIQCSIIPPGTATVFLCSDAILPSRTIWSRAGSPSIQRKLVTEWFCWLRRVSSSVTYFWYAAVVPDLSSAPAHCANTPNPRIATNNLARTLWNGLRLLGIELRRPQKDPGVRLLSASRKNIFNHLLDRNFRANWPNSITPFISGCYFQLANQVLFQLELLH
jgi:hypothetical protein